MQKQFLQFFFSWSRKRTYDRPFFTRGSIWSYGCQWVRNMHLYTNCIEIGWFVVGICRFYYLQDGGRAPFWIFKILAYSTWPLSQCFSACKCKMSRNRTIDCWFIAKKRFLKWQPSAILNFKIFIFATWLSSSSKFAVVYHISSKSDDFSLRYGP